MKTLILVKRELNAKLSNFKPNSQYAFYMGYICSANKELEIKYDFKKKDNNTCILNR